MNIIEFYEKIGGKFFYQGSINKDSFWRDHYVFWGQWHLSVLESLGLMGFNEFFLPLAGLRKIPVMDLLDLHTGIKFIDVLPSFFVYLLPFMIFNYFFFLYKKRYLDLMEKYKDVNKYFLLWILAPLIFFVLSAWGCIYFEVFKK